MTRTFWSHVDIICPVGMFDVQLSLRANNSGQDPHCPTRVKGHSGEASERRQQSRPQMKAVFYSGDVKGFLSSTFTAEPACEMSPWSQAAGVFAFSPHKNPDPALTVV